MASCAGGKCLQMAAMLLAMMAAMTLGLGVANVIAVYFFIYNNVDGCKQFPTNSATCPYRDIITLAFIGSGIWGSLVIFVIGLIAIKSVKKSFAYRTVFRTATFVTAVIVIPTMIILNAINAALVGNENPPNPLFNISNNVSGQGRVLLALPICICVIALLEFLLMAGMLVNSCLCSKQTPSREPDAAAAAETPKPPQSNQAANQPSLPTMDQAAGLGVGPYSPYSPVPYGRPLAYGRVADYGRLEPMAAYRPALRTQYMYPPAPAGYNRYPMARPYNMSYLPQGY